MTKIAIIEDDPVISQMYRMKFEADGFEVELANNGERGVALVESFQPDMILMDLQMPEMNGAEALAIIRKNEWGKDIPVIILTNLGEEESPEGALQRPPAPPAGQGPHQDPFLTQIGDDVLHRQVTAVDDDSQCAYDHWFHVSYLPIV